MNRIPYPAHSGGSEAQQLAQLRSYLYQLADQLNLALEAAQTRAVVPIAGEKTQVQQVLPSLKALIIKSGEVVEACSQAVEKRLEGHYVAQSEFGTYTRQASQEITANQQQLQQVFTQMEEVVSQVEGIQGSVLGVSAHIKTGMLGYDGEGLPEYGLEIGQRTYRDGEEIFHKYARFTGEKLAFYDRNGLEVAYISDRKLFITHVHITGTFLKGRFEDMVLEDGSVVTKWV